LYRAVRDGQPHGCEKIIAPGPPNARIERLNFQLLRSIYSDNELPEFTDDLFQFFRWRRWILNGFKEPALFV
jgi:hypothetical protein